MITVYTTVFGNTDPLHTPLCEKHNDVRYVCFTDQEIASDYWEIVKLPPQEAPTRMARTFKTLSHIFANNEYSLWIDANFTLKTCPTKLIICGDFVCFRHRDRNNISDEANAIIQLKKSKGGLIRKQLKTYQNDGFCTPENPQTILSCTGVVLRKHTPEVIDLNKLWYQQINTLSLRDQMSIDYCAWKLNYNLRYWQGVHNDNPHFIYKMFQRPVNDV